MPHELPPSIFPIVLTPGPRQDPGSSESSPLPDPHEESDRALSTWPRTSWRIAALILSALLAFSLSLNGALVWLSFFLVAVVCRVANVKVTATALLGAALPLAGMTGGDTFAALAVLVLALEGMPESRAWWWATPFLAIAAAWVILDLTIALLLFVVPAVDAFGVSSVWIVRSTLPTATRSLFILAALSCVPLYHAFFRCQLSRLSEFKWGVIVGSVPSIVLLLLQRARFLPEFFVRQTAYWNSLGRLTGSFSDPNILGLSAFFLAVLLVHEARSSRSRLHAALFGSLAVLWIVAGGLSGSRSFVIGTFLTAMFLMSPRRAIPFTVGVLFLGVGTLNLVDTWSPSVLNSVQGLLPAAAVRAIDSVIVARAGDALFSRTAFFALARAVWLDHPFTGIGFGHFRSVVPTYSAALRIPIGIWQDNPNDFYLGILAELGISGFLVFVLSLKRLRWEDSAPSALVLRGAIGSFVILLFFGCHLESAEVALLFAATLATTVAPKRGVDRWTSAEGVLICAVAIVATAASIFDERGFYDWENSGNSFARWSGPIAHGIASCGADRTATIELMSSRPGAKRVKVSLSTAMETKRINLGSGMSEKVSLRCGMDGGRLHYVLWARPPFVPSREVSGSRDNRLLGVQIRAKNLEGQLATVIGRPLPNS